MNDVSLSKPASASRRFQWRLFAMAVLMVGIAAWLFNRDRQQWARMFHQPAAGPQMPLWQEATVAAAEPLNVGQFDPVVVVPRPMPYITNFPVASVAVAKKQLQAAELVLGVVVDGAARAYPINMLTGPSREILNDTLAGTAIAATW
jgi:hypothetical protein